jgi:hypothetical protein
VPKVGNEKDNKTRIHHVVGAVIYWVWNRRETVISSSNAIVVATEKDNTYLSLPCVPDVHSNGLKDRWIMRLEEARIIGLKPDPDCINSGGFIQEERSLSGHILELVGILSPIPRRLSPNGTWDY